MDKTRVLPTNRKRDSSLPRRRTFEELIALAPEKKCDLIDGTLIYHSPVSLAHDELRGFLETILRHFIQEKKLGKILGENFPIKLAEQHWREPDLAFISNNRLTGLQKTHYHGVPNLIIEVLSDDSHYRDKIQKRAEYEHLGVEEYWILDPTSVERSVFFFRDNDHYMERKFEEGTMHSISLQGFFLRADWLWPKKQYPNLFDVCRQLGIL